MGPYVYSCRLSRFSNTCFQYKNILQLAIGVAVSIELEGWSLLGNSCRDLKEALAEQCYAILDFRPLRIYRKREG